MFGRVSVWLLQRVTRRISVSSFRFFCHKWKRKPNLFSGVYDHKRRLFRIIRNQRSSSNKNEFWTLNISIYFSLSVSKSFINKTTISIRNNRQWSKIMTKTCTKSKLANRLTLSQKLNDRHLSRTEIPNRNFYPNSFGFGACRIVTSFFLSKRKRHFELFSRVPTKLSKRITKRFTLIWNNSWKATFLKEFDRWKQGEIIFSID